MVRSGDHIVFYGSLRPPYETRRRIGIDAMVRHVAPARLRGALHDLGSYPAFVHGVGEVAGDLFEVVDDRLAAVLDPFEGFDPADPSGSPYVREIIDVVDPRLPAWIYRYMGRPPPGSMVPGGHWVALLIEKSRDGTLGPRDGP